MRPNTDDIEWTTMMDFKIGGRGPKYVAEGMLIPLVAEWSSFGLSPTELIAGDDGHTVVLLGHFSCVHGARAARRRRLRPYLDSPGRQDRPVPPIH